MTTVTTTSLQRAQAGGNASTAVMQQPNTLPTNETASSATAAKMKAIVQARYEVAFFRPRDMDVVRQRMLKECQRPTFADVARYNRPIGKGVVGPSIRFAEMAVRCMSNIVVETTTVYDDREKRIVNVSVTDLEGNVPYAQDVTITKAVERRKVRDGDVVLRQRTNSYGDPVFLIEATDDEILNQQNALISKAIRTLGLRLIPGDIVDECMELVIATQKNKDAEDPDSAKRKLFGHFADIGVSADQLKAYLGGSAESLTPKELTVLRGIYSAIKDGETTWREVIDSSDDREKKKPKADSKQEPKADPVSAKPAAKEVVAEAKQEQKNEKPVSEPDSASETAATSYADVLNRITDATTIDDVLTCMQEAAQLSDSAQRAELSGAANVRMKALRAAKKSSTSKSQAEFE